ncbi:MAG: NAD-dependent epimerase/dehydratase family protein [Lysobacterales bacterium]|jgi:dihydroflavonol-4-reductase
MNRVVVTGASGHIGANLARELLARGYRVAALLRQSSLGLEGLDVERLQGDVLDLASLRRAFQGADTVYHLAAYISIRPKERDRLFEINVEGTRNVLAACCAEGVDTLVHFSSIHALDMRPSGLAVTENTRLLEDGEGSDYDQSKAQADRLVRANDCATLSTRIIYPTAVIGPHDYHHSLTGQAIARMARGSLPMLIAGGFDWVDARDVASGAINAAEKGADGDRYILSGHYRGIAAMAREVHALGGAKPPRWNVSPGLARPFAPLMIAWAGLRGEEPLYTKESLETLTCNRNVSHALAAEKLGYRSRPFLDSLRDTLSAAGYAKVPQVE